MDDLQLFINKVKDKKEEITVQKLGTDLVIDYLSKDKDITITLDYELFTKELKEDKIITLYNLIGYLRG